MFMNLLRTVRYVVVVITVSAWGIGWGNSSAFAQSSGQRGGTDHRDATSAEPQHESVPVKPAGHDQPPVAPHGGQLTALQTLTFEVVYQKQEIRVYIYGPFPQPASGKDVKGEISWQPRGDKPATHLTLRHVTPPEHEPDYLSVPVDLSRVKDGELTATIRLENVPLPQHPTTTFKQEVSLSKVRLQVVLAELDPSDQARITRQRVCPVTGAELGSMGGPVKVLVGGQPLYLCCEGCVGKVQSAPEKFLQKANPASQGE
ncbi:MAG: hypothetical protein ACYC3X_00555 [Pirellulaceae bacterium]